MVSIEEQFKYIKYLEYSYVYSKDDYNKLTINIKSLVISYKCNINKLPNTLIKLNIWYYDYLNNLPLNLKILSCHKVKCNLPPILIYLVCDYDDIYNLPRSLQFIYYSYIKLPIELIDYNYNKKNINFIYFNENIIKLKSIY